MDRSNAQQPLTREKVLLVYPLMGMSGTFVKHPPLGPIYAASEVIRDKVADVEILDIRLHANQWQKKIQQAIGPDTLLVGISVMTGKPVLSAMEISRFIKSLDSEIIVVWGGPFATFHPDLILQDDPHCDLVVSGYGAHPFRLLLERLLAGENAEGLPGISYRKEGEICIQPPDRTCHEKIPFKEIPYHLIEDYGVYGQLEQDKRIFSINSAMGCVYKCGFCSSPVLYFGFKEGPWVRLPAMDVVDHIEHLVENYDANYIYFIDDDSFINLQHVENIIDEIAKRELPVKLGFRGARINEIKKMSADFLIKLAQSGTDIMHVGAESGSNRILELMRKNCTVDDVLECNRKLASRPEIAVFYNFIMALPSETIDDLKKTAALMLQLYEENPNCIIGTPNTFRPLPGSELCDIAVKDWGYKEPDRLVQFGGIEVEGDVDLPWVTPEMKRFCRLLVVTSYFIDHKITRLTSGNTLLYKILRLLGGIYAPIARWRLRNGFSHFLIEYHLYRFAGYLLSLRSSN
ncbi:B12-binding domain-containing radical SAM protein [Magnetococcales bacterium HHB-1]